MPDKKNRKETAAPKKGEKTRSTVRKPSIKKSAPEIILTQETQQGWGKHDTAVGLGASPSSLDELVRAVRIKEPSRRIGRGLGRAYGDAAMNDGGVAIRFNRLDRAVSFDPETGLLVAEAGMTLAAILRMCVPQGWFLPVTPGTAHPSLGGSVACDVHGKNHHNAGTIGSHVKWIDLVIADGDVVRCSPKRNKALFNATIGGMGLTGLIYRVALQMHKIETSFIVEEANRVGSLPEMMERLTVSDATHPYTVSWVDGVSPGPSLGRGHVLLGRHASLGELKDRQRNCPLAPASEGAIPVPFTPPLSLVNNLTVRMFNALQYHRAPARVRTHTIPFRPYFYPLDIATNWNRLYGTRGFYQYQYVVPFEDGEVIVRETLSRLQKEAKLPSLIVLKRFGDEGEGYLSFPKPGWVIAIDIPISDGLDSILNEFDAMVAMTGGRVYLVKDARMSPETFRRMYPRFGEWLKVKNEVDPKWTFSSNLSRRLKMEEGV